VDETGLRTRNPWTLVSQKSESLKSDCLADLKVTKSKTGGLALPVPVAAEGTFFHVRAHY
jgi:hypothetical protein